MLTNQVYGLSLIDVTPLTLSIETTGGVATPIITRNTIIPVNKTQIFSTTYNNQSNVDIKIVQGERLKASENKLLGRFQLNDIEPAPAGVPQIEISFSIDINGIMSISARDLRTNKQNSITITNSSNLDNNQIQRMYREAQEYKEKDEQFRKQADIRNKVDKMTIELDEIISKSKFLRNKELYLD